MFYGCIAHADRTCFALPVLVIPGGFDGYATYQSAQPSPALLKCLGPSPDQNFE